MDTNIDYRKKYKEYKRKYLEAKHRLSVSQQGGGIDEFKGMFNAFFGSDWILTGSEAIKVYLEYFERKDLLKFTPNDVDIIYVSNDKIYRDNFDGFKRKQSQAENSMTFENGPKSFDISTTKGPVYYYEINGIKLMTPMEMYNNYEENMFHRQSEIEKSKLEALLEINKIIQSKSIEKKRLPVLSEEREMRNPISRSLFSSSDDESSHSPPPKISRLNFN